MWCKGCIDFLARTVARHERELLVDLSAVSVTCYSVRLEALIEFTERVLELLLTSRAGYSGCSIDDDACLLDESCLKERRECENGACGVAAGVGYQLRIFDLFPVKLGESVDRSLKEFRMGMIELI